MALSCNYTNCLFFRYISVYCAHFAAGWVTERLSLRPCPRPIKHVLCNRTQGSVSFPYVQSHLFAGPFFNNTVFSISTIIYITKKNYLQKLNVKKRSV